MSDLKAQFDTAVADVQRLSAKPDNATLLALYGLFKQATMGDVKGDRPEGFDFVAAAKFDAWDGRRGMSRDDAMASYVALVAKLTG